MTDIERVAAATSTRVQIRNQLKLLGKEVAEANSTTQFPDWCLLKIGISTIQGYSFDTKYWEQRISVGSIDSGSD